MAETGLPLGAVYTGATIQDLEQARKVAESRPEGYTPTAFDPATKSQGGYVVVGRNRVPEGKNKPPTPDAVSKGAKAPYEGLDDHRGFRLWYEMHGTGENHVVFIMGLNNSCFGWLNQVEHLTKKGNYSCLVHDNRGYGNSDTPAGHYKTSEMAQDVVELLDHVQWTKARSLHIVGISMGGMISLELAKAIPERIASLSLISTTSGRGLGEKDLRISFPPLSGVKIMARIISGRTLGFDSDEYRVNAVCDMLFPPSFLDQKDDRDSKGRTRREVFQELFAFRYTYSRRQTLFGALAQIQAALTHRVTRRELSRINDAIPKITIITGDTDNLVNPGNSHYMKKVMPKAELHLLPNVGHVTTMQETEKVNNFLEETFSEGKARLAAGKW